MKADSCSSGHDETARTSVEAAANAPSAAVSGGDDDNRVVVFEGNAFHGIKELGFNERSAFILSFHTTPPPMPRGGYFTALAISPKSYRAKHRTKCGFADEGSQVVVYDDWNRMHPIAAPRSVLDPLIANMRAHDLPEREAQPMKARRRNGSPASTDDGQMNEGNPHD